MSDLNPAEQQHVRAALRVLHRRMGTWAAVAAALHCSPRSLEPVTAGRSPVSASIALRTARLAGVMIDDLLVGRFLPPGACPNCGFVPTSDFTDEHTVVENGPREPAEDLVQVK